MTLDTKKLNYTMAKGDKEPLTGKKLADWLREQKLILEETEGSAAETTHKTYPGAEGRKTLPPTVPSPKGKRGAGASWKDWKGVDKLVAQGKKQSRKEFMDWFRSMDKPKAERMRGYAGEKAPAPAAPASAPATGATATPEVTSPDLEAAYKRFESTGKGIRRPSSASKALTGSELTKARQGFAEELKGLYGKLGKEGRGDWSPEEIASGVAQRATRQAVWSTGKGTTEGIAEKAKGLGLRQKDVSDFLQKTYAKAPEQKATLTQGDKKQKIRQSIAGKQETPGARYEREKKGQDERQAEYWADKDADKILREDIAAKKREAARKAAEAKRSGAAPVKQGERDSSMAATEETERSVTYRGTGGMMDLYKKKPTGTGTGIASGAKKPVSTSFLKK